MKSLKIGFIGCGNMAQALIKGLLSTGLVSSRSIAINDTDISKKQRVSKNYKVKTCLSNKEVVKNSNIIILAIKPQDADVVSSDIYNAVTKDKLLISILAGITARRLKENLPKCRIIRAMPNAPAIINCGITAIGRTTLATKKDYKLARQIFSCVGDVIYVRENLLNAVTAVSGSGPAYFFLFKDAIIKGAGVLGIDKKTAEKLVFATALGSARLAAESDKDIRELISKVKSRGGTTEAAFKVFDHKKIYSIIKKAILAAAKRAKELSR